MSVFKRPWSRGFANAGKPDGVPSRENGAAVGQKSGADGWAGPAMSATGRDFTRFECDDVRLKFWLPDLMDQALAELEIAMGISRSELVRMTLFQYLYGRYDYVAMQIHQTGFFKPVGRRSDLKYSRRVRSDARTPELRKNLNDVSVHLPLCIKDDLQASAKQVDVPLSVHIREVLISELLGRLYLVDRARFSATDAAQDVAIFEPIPESKQRNGAS